MARFLELAFHPSINEIVPAQGKGQLTVFTGGNNSGKSAYLKKTIYDADKLYIGVNRFYSFHHLPLYNDNPTEKAQWHQNMQQQSYQEYQNFEGSFFNASGAITRLKDDRRTLLFNTFTEMFGARLEVKSEDPDNAFANKYVAVDGESLSITSSGTRLFLGMLAALMDDRFTSVAIDEPELGLSPTLQRKLADIIVRGERRDVLFPHAPNIILSTHSHLFLDKNTISNNWKVSKSGNLISATQFSGIAELHDAQFRLLGNDLGDLLLPSAVIFVEGDTDKLYIEKILALHMPNLRCAVQSCGGDIAKRLAYWSSSLGDMQVSPYRNRTIVINDRVKQSGIERACQSAGLPESSIVEWSENGIEYVYPENIMSEIFKANPFVPSKLVIDDDRVLYGEINYKKMQLCTMVCDKMNTSNSLHPEVNMKLLITLRNLVAEI